jgi:hypothetical protein
VLTAFWSSIGGKLADRFAALSAPALVFWFGGLLAWTFGHGGIHALNQPASWLSHKSALTQAVAVLVILLGVAASGLVVGRLTTPVLRLLEGYWPAKPARLIKMRDRLIEKAQQKATDDEGKWQALTKQTQPPATATPQQLADIARLDLARHRRPDQPNLFMPTRIGNILRAAETRPRGRYGLDAVATWPQLWLALPDSTRQEIGSARQALDGSVAASIWGILFFVFIPWTILALPVGLAAFAIAVTVWVPARAEAFGDLVDAAYDIHRTVLYQQLRWPLPTDPRDEVAQGKLLTNYLLAGSDDPTPKFTSQS